jgi:predicted peptidase
MRPVFLACLLCLGLSGAEFTLSPDVKAKPVHCLFSQSGERSNLFSRESYHYELRYLAYLPASYKGLTSSYNKDDAVKKWPLVIFLHGSGERGSELDLVRKNGLPFELDRRDDTPYIMIAPQCPANERWNVVVLEALLANLLRCYSIDEKRVVVTGLSLGGFGSWAWACEHPERFAGVIPVCGGIEPAKTSTLKGMPIWAFHGDQDKAVPLERGQLAAEAAKKNGADVKFTVYPGVGHNSWEKAYAEPELEAWILARKR